MTSPPYGPSSHGRVTTGAAVVHTRHHLYGDLLDRGNLANIGHHRLLAGFTRILTLTTPYLRPGGRVAALAGQVAALAEQQPSPRTMMSMIPRV